MTDQSDEERDTDGVSRELATVTRLPARRDDDGGEVVEAEVVSEQEYLARQRWAAYRQDVVTVARVTHAAVMHERVVPVWRHGAYVLTGGRVLAERAGDWISNGFVNRQLRAADDRRDHEAVERWWDRRRQAKKERHDRIMDYIELPFRLARAAIVGLLLMLGALFVLGIAYAWTTGQIEDVATPLLGVLWLLATLVWLVTVTAVLIPPAIATLAVTACWTVGRRHAHRIPAALAPPNMRRDALAITPSKVVTAVRDLGLAELRKAILEMEDAGAAMLSPIRVAGCGVEVDVTIPPVGVTTADVIARRRKLAENIDRYEHEVYVTVSPAAPRTVRIWIADSGALDEPIPPSPLVLDPGMRASYHHGAAPWCQNLRGDALPISVHQRHMLGVGLSNQGKTKSARALALWLAQDPRPELRVADLKGAGDWAMFDGLATVLVEGPSDDHVIAATLMLEGMVVEMDRRLAVLAAGGKADWDPLVGIVDEAQQAYMCPAKDDLGRPYGGSKNTSRYLTAVRKIQNQGRAVDVLLWQFTQNPSNQNLPVLAREGAHLRWCTAVGTDKQARMALGDKAVDGGAAPHLLRPGLDKGTLVVAGDGAPLADGESSVTVRVHFVDDDAAVQLAERAKQRRGPVKPLVDPEVERDLLADVADALGPDERVKATDVAARLRELAPGYGPYERLNGEQLADLLRERGVEVRYGRGGYPTVRRDRVYAALDAREATDGAGE